MTSCITCSQETSNPRFCSRSCAAKHNNKGVRRHGEAAGICLVCGKPKANSKAKYCSNICQGVLLKKHKDPARLRAERRHWHSKWRQIKYTPFVDPTMDDELIIEFYMNCPEGYEVDHKVALSRGGLHHQDNLQYLTKFENMRKYHQVDKLAPKVE